MTRLLFALLLLASTVARAATWEATSAWVKDLDEKEQRIAVVSLNGQLLLNTEKVVAPAINNDPKNLMWTLKILAYGNGMLQQLTTKSPELSRVLQEQVDLLSSVIRGERPLKDYPRASAQTVARMRRLIEQINPQDAARVEHDYGDRLEQTGTALIAYAKLLASESEKGRYGAADEPTPAQKRQWDREFAANATAQHLKTLQGLEREIAVLPPSRRQVAVLLAAGMLSTKLSDWAQSKQKELPLSQGSFSYIMAVALYRLSSLAQSAGLADAATCHYREAETMRRQANGEAAAPLGCREKAYGYELQQLALRSSADPEMGHLTAVVNRWVTEAAMLAIYSAKADGNYVIH